MRKTSFTLVATLALAALFEGHAEVMTWTNAAGGDYLTAGNWNPAGPPGAGDTAVLDGTPSAAVTLGGNTTNYTLQVSSGSGPVTLDLGGKSLDLRNYDNSTTYANWAFTCLANATLSVTNGASGGKIDGLGSTANDSSSLFIDSGATLTFAGVGTLAELLQARVAAGGHWRIAGGADVTLGSDPARGTSYYYGNDPDAVALVVDGAGSTYWDVTRYIQNCTMVLTNGGMASNYRNTYLGNNGSTAKLLVSGTNSQSTGTYLYIGTANSRGYVTVNQGGRYDNVAVIAMYNNCYGELIVTGEGSRAGPIAGGGTYLRICDGSYTGTTGMLVVADSALGYYRYLQMRQGGVVRLDDGTLEFTWGNATDRRSYNRGGRVEGTGTIKKTGATEGWFLNDEGGVIAPGLPVGTLTFDGWGTSTTLGAFTNDPTGKLEFEIASTTSYDRIVFSNSRLHLGGGTLAVTLRDGFQPSIGDSFDLLDFDVGTLSGQFDFVLMPALNGARWSTENLYVDGTVSVVEETEDEALTFTWKFSTGGDFGIAGFWTPEGGPPGANDAAVLTGTLSAPIHLSVATDIDTLQISNATATLDLNGNDLQILNDAVGLPCDQWGVYGNPGSVLTLMNSGVSPAKFGGPGTAEDGSPNLCLSTNVQLTLSANVQAAVASVRMADGARLELDGGTLTTTAGSGVLVDGGAISGEGLIENVAAADSAFINQGRVAPGPAGSATLTLDGFNNVSNAPGSEMAFQIRSSLTGCENDRLAVTNGHLTLGGTLRVTLVWPYDLPTNGASYNLLDWDTCSGTFDTIELPGKGVWSTDNLYVDGTISSAAYVLPPDLALTYVWTNAAGGDFMEGANWDPYGPPGTNDTARLAGNSALTVHLSSIHLTNDTLQAVGGPLTLDLNGFNLPLRNYSAGTPYTNCGFYCMPDSQLVVTNGGEAAHIGTQGDSLETSASVLIDDQAVLTLAGPGTTLVGSHFRTEGGGQLVVRGGAHAVSGSDPVRTTSYYYGSDSNAVTPALIVDGTDSTYWDVVRYVLNSAVLATNGGSITSYRYLYIGDTSGFKGGVIASGAGTQVNGYSALIRNGYVRVEAGAKMLGDQSVGMGNNASADLLVTGAGSECRPSYFYICRSSFNSEIASYPGATGTVTIADGGLLQTRYMLMATGGTVRLDSGTLEFVWNNYDRRSLNDGGRVEGIGTIRNIAVPETWFENNGAISPGLPDETGTLTFEGFTDFVNGAGGAMEFQIGGDTTNAHGRLVLKNSALQLDGGTLRIALADGYKPQRRTTYQLFDWSSGGSLSGAFDAVELPGYGQWLIADLYEAGTVTVIPSSATLLFIR